METVWKYELDLSSSQNIKVPMGFTVLKLDLQKGRVVIWLKVHTLNNLLHVNIQSSMTGHEVPGPGEVYIGTVQIEDVVIHYWMI